MVSNMMENITLFMFIYIYTLIWGVRVQRFKISNKGLRMLRLCHVGHVELSERAIPRMLWHSGIMASATVDDCEAE